MPQEGTELYKWKRYHDATAQYLRALEQSAQMSDLSADEQMEVHAMQLSLHLNLAMVGVVIRDGASSRSSVRNSCHRSQPDKIPRHTRFTCIVDQSLTPWRTHHPCRSSFQRRYSPSVLPVLPQTGELGQGEELEVTDSDTLNYAVALRRNRQSYFRMYHN